jgi:hypothetical protein
MRSLLFLLAIAVLVLAQLVMPHIFSWLRVKSRLPAQRPEEETGLPASIMGAFERILAAVVVAANVPNAYALIAAWLGAKLAASWQRLPVDKDDPEAGRKIRAWNAGCSYRGRNIGFVRRRRGTSRTLRFRALGEGYGRAISNDSDRPMHSGWGSGWQGHFGVADI